MGTTLNRHAYQRMIDDDLAWLDKQPHTLEREHVIDIVRLSPDREYGPAPMAQSPDSLRKVLGDARQAIASLAADALANIDKALAPEIQSLRHHKNCAIWTVTISGESKACDCEVSQSTSKAQESALCDDAT